jgi:heme exporter protein D
MSAGGYAALAWAAAASALLPLALLLTTSKRRAGVPPHPR